MFFEIVGEIAETETIAEAAAIRQLTELCRAYGAGFWRKRKGVALVRLTGGIVRKAEVHWYEAHGIGRRRLKIKRFLDA